MISIRSTACGWDRCCPGAWCRRSARAPSWRALLAGARGRFLAEERVDVEGGDSGHGYRRVRINDRRKRCASRITLQRLRIASTNGRRPYGRPVRHLVITIWPLPPALSRRSLRVARGLGRSLHTIRRERHARLCARHRPPRRRAARLPRGAPRSSSCSARRAVRAAASNVDARFALLFDRDGPGRRDRCVTTASQLDPCARRGHARRPPHSVSATTRVPRARSPRRARPGRSRREAAVARRGPPIQIRRDNADARPLRTPPSKHEKTHTEPRLPTPRCFVDESRPRSFQPPRGARRSSTAARTTRSPELPGFGLTRRRARGGPAGSTTAVSTKTGGRVSRGTPLGETMARGDCFVLRRAVARQVTRATRWWTRFRR